MPPRSKTHSRTIVSAALIAHGASSILLVASNARAEPPSAPAAPIATTEPAASPPRAAQAPPEAGAQTPIPEGPAPAPAPAAPSPAAPPAPAPEGLARVHLAVNYPNAWLELRNHIDATDWQRACAAPCDVALRVDGMEARVVAPGMTTSNVFRLEPGHGTARFRVNGGSSRARGIGLTLMIGGVPVALGGFAVLGVGRLEKNDGLQTAGAVTLGAGVLSVLVALPLLISGSSTVKDARGDTIAGATPAQSNFRGAYFWNSFMKSARAWTASRGTAL